MDLDKAKLLRDQVTQLRKNNNLKVKKDLIKRVSTTAAQLLIPKYITRAIAVLATE